MQNFIDEYVNWLKSNMSSIQLKNGMTEITTPFLDRNNDYTQIYIYRRQSQGIKFLMQDIPLMILLSPV